jgi:biopolymer transport protein ExbD
MRTQLRRIGPNESSHGIDLAPMLDFVVNLLIFFIITAVFIKESGVTVARPDAISSDSDKPTKSIVLSGDDEVSIDGKVVDVRAIRAHIEQFRAVDPASGVVIVADDRASTGLLVAVVDQTHLGGIHDITFSTAR